MDVGIFPGCFPLLYAAPSVSDTSGSLTDCAGPTSGLDDEVRARLDEFRRTGYVVWDGIAQGDKLGESPYGIVYEVSL